MWTVKTETRASLDDSLTLLCETLERLKAASAGDIAEVIEQLTRAEESARTVRGLVSSELDALIGEIQKSLEAKTVERRRSRLLALVTVLERGRIVHRRASRRSEVNQLRDQAIKELRSQAGMKGAPPTLPGPEAGQWVEWACALKEPEDAESLQSLRDRFTHLDQFVANLEPDMWIAARSSTLEILPEAERSTDKTHQEQARPGTSGFEEPVVSASTLSLVTNLARHFNHPVEPPSPAEVPRVTSAGRAPTFDIRTGAEEILGGKWRMLVATVVVLVLLLAAVGVIQWRSQRNHTSNGPLPVAESKVPDSTPSNSENKASDQSGTSKGPETHASSPKLQAEKQSKLKNQSVAPSTLSKKEEAPPGGATEVTDSVPGGYLTGVLDRMMGFLMKMGVAQPKIASQTVWVSSGFAQGLLVRQVKPRYPAEARKARIQGTVILRAEIEKDGSVQDVIALQGHSMLTQAAVDAVKQWRYKPYTLNGEPVEAETRIYLNFTLYDE